MLLVSVPTSEVGYTPAMRRREDHKVLKGHVVALKKRILRLVKQTGQRKESSESWETRI